jgi:CO dehydrogenase/acetyl-CoA synthase delta subunit
VTQYLLLTLSLCGQAADMEVQMEKELQQSLNLTQLTHLIEEASSVLLPSHAVLGFAVLHMCDVNWQMVYAARLAAINAAREVANWSVMAEQAKAAIEARETWLAGLLQLLCYTLLALMVSLAR